MNQKLARLVCRLRSHQWGAFWNCRTDDSLSNICDRCSSVRIADPGETCWKIRREIYPSNRVPFPLDKGQRL